MPWLQLNIQTTAEYTDSINTYLNLLGAVAITLQDAADQPLLEPELNTTPLWDQVNILSLFNPDISIDKIIAFIKTQLSNNAIRSYHTELLAEKNWERAWLKDFHAMKFGKNLWICPSVETPVDPNAVNIILDPGLAFGTGTHPTTALCLEWLDANPPQNQTVIDYGCGSGILAIAALKLGAQEVWAIDHDEQALIATRDNAERNQINLNQLQIALPKQLPKLQADLLIANIIANPLIELAPYFAQLIKPHGKIVLSGILKSQTDDIKQAYAEWFTIKNIAEKDEWIRIEGVRESTNQTIN